MKNRLRKPRLSHSSLLIDFVDSLAALGIAQASLALLSFAKEFFTKKNKTMYTDRQIASLVVCLQRPEAAEADLALLSKKCPSIDVAAYRISPRRNQASILRHLLTVCTRDEIEKNRLSSAKNTAPAASPSPKKKDSTSGKQSPAKKKPSQKKTTIPASAGETSTTATPSSQPSSTTTE